MGSTKNSRLIESERVQAMADIRALQSDLPEAKYPKKALLYERIRLYCSLHKPISYILGYQSFLNLRIACRRPVLIPRWETEEWVGRLVGLIGNVHLRVADLGCGTGAIGLAIAYNCPNTSVTCIDIDPKAVWLTKHNAQLNNVTNADVILADFRHRWWLTDFDIIVSNPPYIRPGALLASSVRRWESPKALYSTDGSGDVLGAYGSVLQNFSPQATDGIPRFVLEVDGSSHAQAVALLAKAHFPDASIEIEKDSAQIDRVIRIY